MEGSINSVVQIKSDNVLDKSLNGCIGFIKSKDASTTVVAIYHPAESGKNAFVKDFTIPNNHLRYVGEAELKPIKK